MYYFYWYTDKFLSFASHFEYNSHSGSWHTVIVKCASEVGTSDRSSNIPIVSVRDGHGGGWSRKINAWHLYTLMVYL